MSILFYWTVRAKKLFAKNELKMSIEHTFSHKDISPVSIHVTPDIAISSRPKIGWIAIISTWHVSILIQGLTELHGGLGKNPGSVVEDKGCIGDVVTLPFFHLEKKWIFK